MGTLGVALLVTAFALLIHAARGDRLSAGEPLEIAGTTPVHVVGLVEPGRDAGEPATCTVESAAGTETVDVATGIGWESAVGTGLGRKLRVADGAQATVACDQRVAVTTGPVVFAYPLADYAILYPAYLLLAALGFGYARRRSRSPLPSPSPVHPGDEQDRAELRRYAVDVVFDLVRLATGVAAIILGIVGALALGAGSALALVFLLSAGVLGVVAIMVARWRRAGRE